MKAKIINSMCYQQKVSICKAHEEKSSKIKNGKSEKKEAVPAYLVDRESSNTDKVLSNMVKQKRREKAGKWEVQIEKVKTMSETEMFAIIKSGKRNKKAWKRIINKPTSVSETFTRKPPKCTSASSGLPPSATRRSTSPVPNPRPASTSTSSAFSRKPELSCSANTHKSRTTLKTMTASIYYCWFN